MRHTVRLRSIAGLTLAAFTGMLGAVPAQAQPSTNLLPMVQAMSTRNKVLLLAGAAALYWLYKRHQNAKGVGPNGQYYRSRNGRVYYRDARTHKAIWVTPPPATQPIRVSPEEYQRYVGSLPSGYDPNGRRVLTAPPGPAGR
jgi:hypothetical protein